MVEEEREKQRERERERERERGEREEPLVSGEGMSVKGLERESRLNIES